MDVVSTTYRIIFFSDSDFKKDVIAHVKGFCGLFIKF